MATSKIDENDMNENMDIAKESSVQEVSNKIDNAALESTSQEILVAAKAAQTAAESASSSASNGSSPIKSIQRGTYTHESEKNATITINNVDPSKCIVILNSTMSSATPGTMTNGSVYSAYESTLVSLTNTKLTITSNCFSYYYSNTQTTQYKYGTTSWQVIEFI